jgi:A/G-specific adenine glycosylase
VAHCPSINPNERSRLRRKLLQWFRFYKRDLPWRRSRDPYAIWVSEIMLQQTRVAAVLERYLRFMQCFPNVEALAAAPLDDVLAVWSGLGYYRRARMMHEAVRQVVSERGGALPQSAGEWRSLPGVGRYTAAAIASIAFDEPVAVVDGNVERVLTRLVGHPMAGKRAWTAANELLSRSTPGEFNQAMMELGATVCTPKSPACLMCPVREFCATRGEHATAPQPARFKREVHYSLVQRRGKVALVQRGKNESLMAGMWELPTAHVNGEPPLLTLKHAITNTDYTVCVYAAEYQVETKLHVSTEQSRAASDWRWFRPCDISELPLTGLARKILRRADIIE